MGFEKVGVIEPLPLEAEYKKHTDISPGDIHKLRDWVNTQPHLPGDHITDSDLVLFYHCCERSGEVSKQVIDLHYTLRTLFTGLFKDRCFDPRIDNTLNTILYAPLPTPTVHGYRAVYCRLLDPDARNFIFSDVIRAFMMVFDLWQHAEGSWPGLVILIDMEQAKMAHITRLDPMTLRQMLYFLQTISGLRDSFQMEVHTNAVIFDEQCLTLRPDFSIYGTECMLCKLKEVHFLNAPSFMDTLMMLLKPFMKKSLLDIIKIHEIGSESVYQYVPRAAFPKEQGGEYKGNYTLRDELIKRIKDNESFFKEESKKRVDESARPGGKAATVEDLFGIQGSFKKLDID